MVRRWMRRLAKRVRDSACFRTNLAKQVMARLIRSERSFAAIAEAAKREGELEYWTKDIEILVRWLQGEIPERFGIKSPTDREIVRGGSLRQSAILTWTRADRDKYLKHLGVGPAFFAGKRLLEIGCGPLPYALCFNDCSIIGLDPLIALYRGAGYPLNTYDARMRYLCGRGEQIPLRDRSVEAVISVNAIDHVDDFYAVAEEIDRVLGVPR